MRASKALFVLAGLLVVGVTAPAAAGPIMLGPSSYLSEADSPFAGGTFSHFHLEDFEDGLTTPGVTSSGGHVIGPDSFVDSVEFGSEGHSWYSGRTESSITFTFDPSVLGSLPTHVGLVWTDVGWNAQEPYYDFFVFEAFDAFGVSLGSIGPAKVGDGADTGQKDEDRFFGAIYSGGISELRIGTSNTDWEVDHLQYGREAIKPVPEPGMLTLIGLGAALVRARWRRPSRR